MQMPQKDTADKRSLNVLLSKQIQALLGNINLVFEHCNFNLCKFLIVFTLFCNTAIKIHTEHNIISRCNKDNILLCNIFKYSIYWFID